VIDALHERGLLDALLQSVKVAPSDSISSRLYPLSHLPADIVERQDLATLSQRNQVLSVSVIGGRAFVEFVASPQDVCSSCF